MIFDKNAKRPGRRMLAVYQELDPIPQLNKNHSCAKGCAGCCYQLTVVTLAEAIHIVTNILADPEWEKKSAALFKRIYEQIEYLNDPQLDQQSYFLKKLPCIFLDEIENTCRVYDYRPSACRYHFVVSDPKNCFPDTYGTVSKLNYYFLEDHVLKAAAKVSKQCGLPLGLSPLPVAIMWAFKLLTEGESEFLKAYKEGFPGAMHLKYWEGRLRKQEGADESKEAL